MPQPLEPPSLEEQKLELERQKLSLEREKLQVEKYKARLSALSVAVPLIAVLATVGLGVWNQSKASKDQFALKAAEIVMATDNPNVTQNKAAALYALFPEKLPKDFATRFTSDRIPEDPDSARKALFGMVTSNPAHAEKIMTLWAQIYPGDAWVKDLAASAAQATR
jgi:hypothetical protein